MDRDWNLSCEGLLFWARLHGIGDFVFGYPLSYFDVGFLLSECPGHIQRAYQIEYARDISRWKAVTPVPGGYRSSAEFYQSFIARHETAARGGDHTAWGRGTVRGQNPEFAAGLDVLGVIGGIGTAIATVGGALTGLLSGVSNFVKSRERAYWGELKGSPKDPLYILSGPTGLKKPGAYNALARMHPKDEAILSRIEKNPAMRLGELRWTHDRKTYSELRIALNSLNVQAVRIPVERDPLKHTEAIDRLRRFDVRGFVTRPEVLIRMGGKGVSERLIDFGVLYRSDRFVNIKTEGGGRRLPGERALLRLAEAAGFFDEANTWSRGLPQSANARIRWGKYRPGRAIEQAIPEGRARAFLERHSYTRDRLDLTGAASTVAFARTPATLRSGSGLVMPAPVSHQAATVTPNLKAINAALPTRWGKGERLPSDTPIERIQRSDQILHGGFGSLRRGGIPREQSTVRLLPGRYAWDTGNTPLDWMRDASAVRRSPRPYGRGGGRVR